MGEIYRRVLIDRNRNYILLSRTILRKADKVLRRRGVFRSTWSRIQHLRNREITNLGSAAVLAEQLADDLVDALGRRTEFYFIHRAENPHSPIAAFS